MNEQTILECAKCHEHTPPIETFTQESITEAISNHQHCKHCGWHVMLCFDSRVVLMGKSWSVRYAKAKDNSSKLRGTNRKRKARYVAQAR